MMFVATGIIMITTSHTDTHTCDSGSCSPFFPFSFIFAKIYIYIFFLLRFLFAMFAGLLRASSFEPHFIHLRFIHVAAVAVACRLSSPSSPATKYVKTCLVCLPLAAAADTHHTHTQCTHTAEDNNNTPTQSGRNGNGIITLITRWSSICRPVFGLSPCGAFRV